VFRQENFEGQRPLKIQPKLTFQALAARQINSPYAEDLETLTPDPSP
jgi:hypothetical protein